MIAIVGLSLDIANQDPEGFRFALTIAAPDAAILIPRYMELFDSEEINLLFSDLVTPHGSKIDPTIAQAMQWIFIGVKFEVQGRLRTGASALEYKQEVLSRLKAMRPLFGTNTPRECSNGFCLYELCY